jgi:hypothetical protein
LMNRDSGKYRYAWVTDRSLTVGSPSNSYRISARVLKRACRDFRLHFRLLRRPGPSEQVHNNQTRGRNDDSVPTSGSAKCLCAAALHV